MLHIPLLLVVGSLFAADRDAGGDRAPVQKPNDNPYALTDAAVQPTAASADVSAPGTSPTPQGAVDCPYSFAPMDVTAGGTTASGGPPGDAALYSMIGSLTWISPASQSAGGDYTLDSGFHNASYGPVTCFGSSGIDCNNNAIDDECDIAAGISLDRDANCQPDECDDCVTGLDLLANACRINCAAFNGACILTGCGESMDQDDNGAPDECDPDCDGDGTPNSIDVPDVRIFVDADAAGAGDGTSWTDAFTDLQDAICQARSLQPYCTLGTCKTCQTSVADINNGVMIEIWVADGDYKPAAADREDRFRLTTCVGLFGGFSGVENQRSQRDPTANPTVLSGDLLGDDAAPGPGNNAENSFHVVSSIPEGGMAQDSSAILDGFIINSGNANGANLGNRVGGGMIAFTASPTVANCIFENNHALVQGGAVGLLQANTSNYDNCMFFNNSAQQGGAFSAGNSAAVTLTRCRFADNTAVAGAPADSGSGGAFFAQQNSAPVLVDCFFRGNHADRFGGAMYNSSSTARLINVAIVTNDADFAGGAVYNTSSHISVFSSTIAGNNADNTGGPVSGGGGIANDASNPSVVNSIVWGNTAAAASDTENAQIAGGTPGVAYSLIDGLDAFDLPVSNNIDGDPQFADLADGDIDVLSTSPAVDRGDRFQLPLDPAGIAVGDPFPIEHDLAGGIRVNGVELDMGALELFVCAVSFSLDPDYGNFATCDTGPDMPVAPGLCDCFDFDGDDHVGLLDFGLFQIGAD
ncbi:MAG: hypothetical protein HOP29_10535 [Phycisphaerales bacterium]|nr:hypothetical protein [Phycisphaerales bacterium]